MSNTILLKGRGVRKEGATAAILTPGELVQPNSAGTIAAHSVSGGRAAPSFLVENELLGSEITVDYVSGDNCVYETMSPGHEILALVPASAAAIVIGDELESNGDGTLRLIAADVAGVRAAVTFGLLDAGVIFTANTAGEEGNDITIEYLTATAATQTVVVTALAIVIKPDDTTPGTTDQAADIITLVNGSAEASALVVATNVGDGSDPVVEPVAATNLAGGVNTSGAVYPVARAIEAVDNSGGGSEARIKVEIV